MFKITNTTEFSETIAPFARVTTGLNNYSTFKMNSLSNYQLKGSVPIKNTITLNEPVLVGEVSTQQLELLEDVTAITVQGVTYKFNPDPTALNNGEYSYDPLNKTLTIKAATAIPTGSAITYTGYILGDTISTDKIALPDIFKQYRIRGSISISKNFRDHPSASFNLIVPGSAYASVLSIFRNTTTRWVFYNTPFRVNSLNASTRKTIENPKHEYVVSVGFEGWYRQLIEKPIRYRPFKRSTTEDQVHPSCKTLNSEKEKALRENAGSISRRDPRLLVVPLNTLALRNGIPYRGTHWDVEFPIDTQNDATTSFSSELANACKNKGCYPLFSSSAGILTPSWVRAGGSNYLSNIRSDLQISTSLSDTVKSVPPTVISWLPEVDKKALEEVAGNKAPQFKLDNQPITTTEDGDTLKPDHYRSLKTVDLNFNQSGETKTLTVTKSQGGVTLWVEIYTYGLAYLSKDIAVGSSSSGLKLGGLAGSHWKMVERKSIKYGYRSNYLTSISESGWKLAQLKQETEMETLLLNIELQETGEPGIAQEIAAYRFIKVPVFGRTSYTIRPLLSPKERHSEGFITWEECDSKGKLVTRCKADPTWVEPYYLSEERTYRTSFASGSNPQNLLREASDPIFPPLTTGETLSISKITKIKSKDSYSVRTTIHSAHGAGFKTATNESTLEGFSGQPVVHTSRPSQFKLDEKGEKALIEKEDKKIKPRPTSVIVYSSPFTGDDPIYSTESFQVEDKLQAMSAFRVIKAIQIFEQASNINIAIPFTPHLKEGDAVFFNYHSIRYSSRIKTINHEITVEGVSVEGETIAKGGTVLTLGDETSLPVLRETPVRDGDIAPGVPVNTCKREGVIDETSGKIGEFIANSRQSGNF